MLVSLHLFLIVLSNLPSLLFFLLLGSFLLNGLYPLLLFDLSFTLLGLLLFLIVFLFPPLFLNYARLDNLLHFFIMKLRFNFHFLQMFFLLILKLNPSFFDFFLSCSKFLIKLTKSLLVSLSSLF